MKLKIDVRNFNNEGNSHLRTQGEGKRIFESDCKRTSVLI